MTNLRSIVKEIYVNDEFPFGRWRLPGASVVAVGAVPLLLRSLVPGDSLILFVRLHLGLLGAVCCFVSAASVCLAVPSCFRLCSCASFLCCRSALVGRLSVLGCVIVGFPLLLLLLHLFSILSLFVTHIKR